MHYEIWGLDAGNRIAVAQSKAEALAIVREFLGSGWSADDLALGAVPDKGELAGGLPPPLTGDPLKRHVSGVPA